MDGKSNENEGIPLLFEFRDRAIPLSGVQRNSEKPPATRSENVGIHLLAEFNDRAQLLPETGAEGADGSGP
jgi:hypothetical protein